MYLKSLELMGFKSFGKKTVFEFQPGVTAIIGPNGSGKSNICDAVRWVLGEQSAKTLRGTRMSEVIFAGSSELRPAAFSQVKLHLDNEDRRIPIDFSEVTIGRQLYRSGESNYYLNQARSLLSDVKEMLMDTGIGKDGYSVIGQGDIDDIVFQRAQTRRSLIEEAAGITRFKHRKAATLTKLEHTETNITRLRDIVGEISTQLEPLAAQAEKTRRFQALAAEIRNLEVDLLLYDLSALYGENENLESMRKGLLAKVNELQKFLDEIDSKKSNVRSRYQDCENRLKLQQDKIKAATTGIDAIREKGAALKQELSSHQARRQAISEEIATIENTLNQGNSEIADSQERLKDEETREIETRANIGEIDENLSKVRAELELHLKEVAQDKESSFKVAVSMAEKRNRITTSGQQIQILERQLEKSSSDISIVQARVDKFQSGRDKIKTEIEALKQQLESEDAELETNRKKLNKTESDARRNEEELSGVSDRLKLLQARSNLLEELKNSSDSGIFRGVRAALALRDSGQAPGIFGIISDLIKAPKGYETAFETALGGSIQDIVTRDSDTAKHVINLLKQGKGGRATFLPLDMIKPPARLDSVSVPGCLGVAIDLIEYDAKFYNVMSHLLGRVLIFKDLDSAVAYTKRERNFNRIVTIDGEILRSSGAMTGGADSRSSTGLLSRKREQEEIEEQLKKLVVSEKNLSSQTSSLRTMRNNLLTEVRRCEDSIARRRQSMEFFVKTLEKTETDLEQVSREFSNLNADTGEIEAELSRLRKTLTETQTALAELEGRNTELTGRLQALSGREETIQTRIQSLTGMQNDERLSLAQITERVKGLKKEVESAKRRAKEAFDRKGRAIAEVERLDEIIAATTARIDTCQAEFEGSEKLRTELEAKLGALNNEYRSYAKELDSLDHAFHSRSRMEDSSKAKLNELDIKLAEIRTNIGNKEQQLAIEFNFDLTQINASIRKYESREQLLSRISIRRAEQESLEPVNPLAIEDYEKTKERHDFLTTQITDLCDAAASLQQVIAEIEKISTERFLETFGHINQAFGDVFAILFPGGEGCLKLTNKEEPLTSNVEIICRLPGKKLTTIELFSGGEKALISIAMLFSILQVKPPAFCILDEIEAALDEANVRRFTRLLRSFADKTQFILITHNKETMQAVDVIYGITLQKSGISRPISIRLEDQNKIKEFTVTGKHAAVNQLQKASAA